MSKWPATKAKRVLAALQDLGWQIKRQASSHKTLTRAGYVDFVFAFHDGEEIGPKMLARIAKHTGLKPSDL
jgi:predicted RNA binding protein YcfA (HicA-like mRNA interferase family)